MTEMVRQTGGENATPSIIRLRPISAVAKEMMDFLGALILLLLLAVPMTMIAIAIKVESTGPVFFRQPRVGQNGHLFLIWKFRTMSMDGADVSGGNRTQRGDPRITPIGKRLRKTSIDELPQLFNVLAGEMSLVGPRPHSLLPSQRYARYAPNYELRHRVKPGMTGWAQVNGWRGETAQVEQILQRTAHDLVYIQRQSLVFDLWIMLLTAKTAFSSKKDVF